MNGDNNTSQFDDDLRILNHLEKSPSTSQRELVRHTDISLGKVNFLLRALVERGIVKIRRFKNSKNKSAYTYILTPWGISEKTRITKLFLRMKIKEYNKLEREIKMLKKEYIESGEKND